MGGVPGGEPAADVSFVITAGAVGTEPARQQAWAYGEYLAHAGVSGSLPHTVRLGLLLAAGMVFVPWGVYWGLLVP
ncbi:hypothetical protein [Streptomyces sp. NPDC102437]|uniref:hypothetical protein n=1 Tax=Streptomyces sp. NPDC102437 TaxID=3366175 RepID=UPI003803E721